MMGLFGQTKTDSKQQVRELQKKLRLEMVNIKRQIYAIQREEEKVKRQIKEMAHKNNKDVCLILAKSIVHSKKAVNKLYASSAQINSVIMNMQHQMAATRMSGSIQKSTAVMQSMQQLVKVPEIMQTMRDLSKEMTKIGIIEEIIEESMESIEPEELEEQAQEEVDKILWEVTAGELGRAPSAIKNPIGGEEKKKDVSTANADAFIKELESSKS